MLTVKGVVLTQRQIGEQDCFVDILTEDRGVLEVLVKGAGKINSKSGSGVQLFAYSEFCLRSAKKGYALNSVAPIRIFYKLRSSVTAVALASYFAQILKFSVLPQKNAPEILRLFLNCLHYLSEGAYPEAQLKSVFELRIAALLGFMPDVVMCRKCGCYLPETLCFSIENGGFYCKECYTPSDSEALFVEMSSGTLQAIRHIVLRDLERIFAFRLKEQCSKELHTFSEAFLRYHMDARFTTLEFYHTLSGNCSGHTAK